MSKYWQSIHIPYEGEVIKLSTYDGITFKLMWRRGSVWLSETELKDLFRDCTLAFRENLHKSIERIKNRAEKRCWENTIRRGAYGKSRGKRAPLPDDLATATFGVPLYLPEEWEALKRGHVPQGTPPLPGGQEPQRGKDDIPDDGQG